MNKIIDRNHEIETKEINKIEGNQKEQTKRINKIRRNQKEQSKKMDLILDSLLNLVKLLGEHLY